MEFKQINRVILFGGGAMLCHTAKLFRTNQIEVIVVTSARHSHETISLDGNSVKLHTFLQSENIEYMISKNVNKDNKVHAAINQHTLGLSFGAAWIFRKNFINKFQGRLLNCHGSRLPQDRGGGGFSWRILRGDKIGISLIHQIEPGIDTGKIILFNQYTYPANCRLPIDYSSYTLDKNIDLIKDFINKLLQQYNFIDIGQAEYLSTYWPRLSSAHHAYIDWSWKLEHIESFICAFDEPYPGATTFLNNKKVKLKNCLISLNDGVFHPFQTGIIYRLYQGTVFVAAETGALLISSILDEQNDNIYEQLQLGDRLYTPQKYLEAAKQYRAIYTPDGIKK